MGVARKGRRTADGRPRLLLPQQRSTVAGSPSRSREASNTPCGFALCLFLLAAPLTAQAQVLLQGTVQGAETGVVLVAAHVVHEATGRGTITNREGAFELVVPSLPAELRIRYIGYRTQRVTVGPDDPKTLDVRLEPAVYELGELFVVGEDFAANVMRKVIERKQQWRPRLRTLKMRGYTRLTLENDAAIVLLSETVFDSYWDRRRGWREVLRSRRETAEFYRRLRLEPFGYVPNLYDDVIEIQGLRFFGPTHPDALDQYTFNLAQRRVLDDQIVYDIFVAPKTGLDATFIGRVSVLDSVYAVVEAELRPARHVVFPEPVKRWDVFYRQQFVPIKDTFWVPVDLRLEGTIQVDPGDVGLAPASVRQVTRLSEHRVNEALPDAPFARPDRARVDSASVFTDDLFLMGRNIVPLTPRELEAQERLRGAGMTLERAFPPKGTRSIFAAFEARRNEVDGPQFAWPIILGYEPWLRFNRVDGLMYGIGRTLPFSPRLSVEGQAALATGLRRVRYKARVRYRWGRGGTLEGGYARDTAPSNTSSLYPMPAASVAALLDQGDYFDYYWNERGWLRLGYAFPFVRFSVEGRVEDQASVERTLKRPVWFARDFRSNPPINEGRLHATVLNVAVGDGYRPFRTGPLRRIELRAEHSDPDLLGSDFDYTRFDVRLDGYVKTFFPRRPRPNGLHVRVVTGAARGTLPPQRFGVVDGGLGPFSTFGALRSLRDRPYEGDRYAGVFWEHDFRTVPFEALGLTPLVERSTGLRLFGGHGRTWLDEKRQELLDIAPRVPDGFHHELGLALTNVWGTPLRLDVAYRLDEPGLFVGVGLSRLFR